MRSRTLLAAALRYPGKDPSARVVEPHLFWVHEGRPYLSAEVAHLATERLWHHTQQVSPAETGSVVLSMTAAGLPEIAAWVASFGGKARALSPDALVQAVREVHKRGLAAHGARGSGDSAS